MVPILVLLTFIGIIIIVTIYKKVREQSAIDVKTVELNNLETYALPLGYSLMSNHLWLHKPEKSTNVVGLDELLQKFIGVPDNIHLKSPGHIICKGEKLATIQNNGKELVLRSPYDAKITRSNVNLLTSLKIVSTDPYHIGWLYHLEPININEHKIEPMLFGNEAVKWLNHEFIRLKDFVQQFMLKPEPIGVTLADGAEIKTGLMGMMDQEDILEFEKKFLS